MKNKNLSSLDCKNEGGKPKPSPYIVNLKSDGISSIEEKRKIPSPDTLIITFNGKDIENQFTPYPNIWIKQKKASNNLKWYRKFSFSVVFLVLALILFQATRYYDHLKTDQKYILLLTQRAFENLNQGYDALQRMDFKKANYNFSVATREFINAEQLTNEINPLLLYAMPYIPKVGKEYTDGYNILQSGSRLSLSAKYFAKALDNANQDIPFSDKLIYIKDASANSLPLIQEAQLYLDKVNIYSIPEDKQEIFKYTKENLPVLELGVRNFVYLSDFLTETLGHDEKKRYLIPLQNTAELRSTGGFMGSYILLDVYKGKITNLELPGGGSYEMQGGIKKNIRPPKPLQLIAERWEFHDSNWAVDYPTAAQMMEKYYTLSWGSSVDGVISINLPVMEKLVGIIGPIEMPEYEKTLTDKNFWIETQKAVELEYDKDKNKPKQILSDMTPIVIERILQSEPDQIIQIVNLINESLLEKNILVYLKNDEAQKIVETYGWAGKIKQTPGDYLNVVANNIAGGKTDRVIRQTINHKSYIQPNGEIINTVTIKREHTGEKQQDFTGIRNVSYIKILVPKGSELIDAQGFEIPDEKYFKEPLAGSLIDEDLEKIEGKARIHKPSKTRITNEFNKTVFGNWSMIDPGQTTEIQLKYKLPNKIVINKNPKTKINSIDKANAQSNYSLLIQKQPGTNSKIYTEIILPKTLKFSNSDNHTYKFESTLTKDIFFALGITTIY